MLFILLIEFYFKTTNEYCITWNKCLSGIFWLKNAFSNKTCVTYFIIVWQILNIIQDQFLPVDMLK